MQVTGVHGCAAPLCTGRTWCEGTSAAKAWWNVYMLNSSPKATESPKVRLPRLLNFAHYMQIFYFPSRSWKIGLHGRKWVGNALEIFNSHKTKVCTTAFKLSPFWPHRNNHNRNQIEGESTVLLRKWRLFHKSYVSITNFSMKVWRKIYQLQTYAIYVSDWPFTTCDITEEAIANSLPIPIKLEMASFADPHLQY